MDIAIGSYGNRKVGLIGGYGGGKMLISVIGEQEGPFADNEPHSDNATDPTGNNRNRRAKQLSHNPGFHLPQLRPALEEDLINARHSPADVVRSLQLTDGVPDDRADRIGGSRDC